MKKYIKSQRGSLTYEIERQDYSVKFRTPDNYFSHATRTVWYSITGFNVFVQYKGTFYMIDRLDNGDEVATLEFDAITAEEAAAAKMERAAEAMDEAQKAETKTTDAAIIYDAETAEAEARNARFAADYAAHLAKQAYNLAAEAGTSNAASIADTASEYAERAREYARRATETAEQAAAEAEQRAETLEGIEDAETRERFTAQATANQWSAEETAENLEYMQEISAANRAALALLNAYAEAIGEYPDEDDDETQAAYKVARDEITGTSQRASEYDRAIVSDMVEDIAARAAFEASRPTAKDIRAKYDSPYLVWDDAAADPEDLEEPAPLYQRAELLAYLGDPEAYDVDAIEAEATRFTADGARVWSAFGSDLAAIAERHEIVTYYAI